MVGAFLIQADTPADVPRVAAAVDRMFETTPFPDQERIGTGFRSSASWRSSET